MVVWVLPTDDMMLDYDVRRCPSSWVLEADGFGLCLLLSGCSPRAYSTLYSTRESESCRAEMGHPSW